MSGSVTVVIVIVLIGVGVVASVIDIICVFVIVSVLCNVMSYGYHSLVRTTYGTSYYYI